MWRERGKRAGACRNGQRADAQSAPPGESPFYRPPTHFGDADAHANTHRHAYAASPSRLPRERKHTHTQKNTHKKTHTKKNTHIKYTQKNHFIYALFSQC
uniref:B5 n=1 Tax=Human betaherpesvirus 6 TaxID=10368 RepID=A0A649Z5X6_9BETA|nr:hypothetical protein [Human betaherpesvirus 6]